MANTKITKNAVETTNVSFSSDSARYNYLPVKVGAIRYKSKTQAVRSLLARTKLTASEIAQRVGVTVALVSQNKEFRGHPELLKK